MLFHAIDNSHLHRQSRGTYASNINILFSVGTRQICIGEGNRDLIYFYI